MVVRVLVVDDSSFFRRRVTEMLESDPRIKVIGTAENGSEAVQKSSRLKPDVVTMDRDAHDGRHYGDQKNFSRATRINPDVLLIDHRGCPGDA